MLKIPRVGKSALYFHSSKTKVSFGIDCQFEPILENNARIQSIKNRSSGKSNGEKKCCDIVLTN